MRKHRLDRRKKRKKIIIFSCAIIICLFSAGYAAFSTTFVLNGTGKIVGKNAAKLLKENLVTSGDGLYRDIYEENRYVYRGANPDNYINFNGELWRIVAIENDETLKIVKKESLGSMAWDSRTSSTEGPRLNENNTYCKQYESGFYYGCNVWNSKEGIFTNGGVSGTVSENASLNNYLNVIYYNSLNEEAKESIIEHDYGVAPILVSSADDQRPLSEVVTIEKNDLWNGKVALLNISDYLKSSLDNSCDSVYNARLTSFPCSNENYLYFSTTYWLLNSWGNSPADVWKVESSGRLAGSGIDSSLDVEQYASRKLDVYPVVYLKSIVKLSGEGTEINPYRLSVE